MTPRRVLHCHSTFSAGGKELRAVRLMNAFGGAWDHVVLSSVPDALSARNAIAPDIRVHFPVDAPALTGRPSLRRYLGLARYLSTFDLVLTYNWGAMDAVAAARLFPAGLPPLIHHEDGFNADETSRRLLRRTLFRRAALPVARHIVVPSLTLERIATEEWRCPPTQVRRIANGIATEKFGRPPADDALPGFCKRPGDIVVGTIAGLRPVKNLQRLVQALARLEQRVRLVIVGEGPERAALERLAQQLGCADRLLMPGHVPEPWRFIGHFDIFALSSDSEQAPLALLEAMAASLPIVATHVGDVRDMVADQNRPFIIPRNADAAFAGALEMLAADAGVRAKLGAANQKKARAEFDEGQMISRYADLYGITDPTVS